MVPWLLKPDGTTRGGRCKAWPFSGRARAGVSLLWPSLPSRRLPSHPPWPCQALHVWSGSAGRTQRVGATVPLHAMNEQQVSLHLLVSTPLRNGRVNQWPRCPQVLNSNLPGPDLRGPTPQPGVRPPDCSQVLPLPFLCLDRCKAMLIPANKAKQVTEFKTRKVVNYLIQPPRYLKPLVFTLIFLY